MATAEFFKFAGILRAALSQPGNQLTMKNFLKSISEINKIILKVFNIYFTDILEIQNRIE